MKKRSHIPRSDLLWAAAAATLLVLQFWWLPGDRRSSADSYSAAIDGKLGLYRTLQLLFPRVVRDSSRLCPEDPATLLIVSPDRCPSDRETQQLYEFVYRGGAVLFAPDWNEPAVQMRSLGIQCESAAPLPPPEQATQPASQPAAGPLPAQAEAEQESEPAMQAEVAMAEGDGGNDVSPNPVGTDADDASGVVELTVSNSLTPGEVQWRTRGRLELPEWLTWEPLVESRDGVQAATWPIGLGRVTVCSSPDIFSNRSFLSAETRRLAVRLVEQIHQHHGTADQTEVPLVVSEFLNASNSFRQTGALFSPALRGGTLQLILLAVLVLWYGFHRFGPAEVVTTTGRRSLQDSARAVGNLQFRLNDGGPVVSSYLEYVRARLRQRSGPGVQLDDFPALADRTGLEPEEVRRQLVEAQGLSTANHVSAATAAASLRWLSRLLHRLSGSPSPRE